MFTKEDFRQRLTQLRMQKDVSSREMSLSIGANPGYIQNIESGKASPSLEYFLYICEYLKISPTEFFDVDNEDPVNQRAFTRDWQRLDPAQQNIVRSVIQGFLK